MSEEIIKEWPEFELSEDGKIRGDQLADEMSSELGVEIDHFDITFMPPKKVRLSIPLTEEQVSAIATVVENHTPEPLYLEEDYERAQFLEARDDFMMFKAGLGRLSARDKAYAMLGRAFALRDGAAEDVILGITDRASAATYISNKPEWGAMPATARAWIRDELEALALLLQVLLLTERL